MTDRYESPLSSRYASEYMLHLFSQDVRYQTWRKLWVALAKRRAQAGPDHHRRSRSGSWRPTSPTSTTPWPPQREKLVRHDVMAHVYAYGQGCSLCRRYHPPGCYHLLRHRQRRH